MTSPSIVRSLLCLSACILCFFLGCLYYQSYQFGELWARQRQYARDGTITVEGATFLLDPLDRVGTLALITGARDTDEDRIPRGVLKPGDTVIDIGANIGWYTIFAAKLVGASGKVIAFEPEPRSFSFLQRNVALNRLSNVIVENKALSNKEEKVRLFIDEQNRGNHHIFDWSDGRHYIEVDALQLDDYLARSTGIAKVDFIKIDMQGAEGVILEGMRQTLERNPNLQLDVEILPAALKQAGTDPAALLSDLERAGYEFWDIGGYVNIIRPVEVDQLVRRMMSEKESQTNLLVRRCRCRGTHQCQ